MRVHKERSDAPSRASPYAPRRRAAPVRRAPLSVERIVDAAIALIDRQGLAGLTMRGLASSLHVQAMSLYEYFPNKTALLIAVRTALFAKIRDVGADHADGLERMRAVMRATYRLSGEHPGFADLLFSSPLDEPILRQGDADLAALQGMGLSHEDAVYALHSLISFATGVLHQDWVKLPVGRDASFEYGLDLILSGLRTKLSHTVDSA